MKHVNITEPSFAALSFGLRHPEIWPEGYQFGYDDIDHCAIELGSRLWARKHHEVEKALHAENKAAMAAFVEAGRKRGLPNSDVTAAMVADDIDGYLGVIG